MFKFYYVDELKLLYILDNSEKIAYIFQKDDIYKLSINIPEVKWIFPQKSIVSEINIPEVKLHLLSYLTSSTSLVREYSKRFLSKL